MVTIKASAIVYIRRAFIISIHDAPINLTCVHLVMSADVNCVG